MKFGTAIWRPRLKYQGFSFQRPPNHHWYFLQSEQSHTSAILRRKSWMASPTHSFFAVVEIGGIARQPTSHEDFAELARSEEQRASYKVKKELYEQKLTMRQNQWCIRFDSSYKIEEHPEFLNHELFMIQRGYRCLHPAWPKRTLDFFYSDRGLPSEIDSKLSSEGETFLDGVQIDIAPDTPAT